MFDLSSGDLKALYPLPNKSFEFETDSTHTVGYVKILDQNKNVEKRHNLNNIIYLSRFCTLSGGVKNNLGFMGFVPSRFSTVYTSIHR